MSKIQQMSQKKTYLNKDGQRVRLSDPAYQIAKRYFGVIDDRPVIKEKPIELQRVPITPKEVIKAQSTDEGQKVEKRRRNAKGTEEQKAS